MANIQVAAAAVMKTKMRADAVTTRAGTIMIAAAKGTGTVTIGTTAAVSTGILMAIPFMDVAFIAALPPEPSVWPEWRSICRTCRLKSKRSKSRSQN